MKRKMLPMKFVFILSLVVAFVMFSDHSYGQKKVVLITGSESSDQVFKDSLENWGYQVSIMLGSEVQYMYEEDFKQYDFAFVSETIGSGDLGKHPDDDKGFRNIPIPLVTTEGWLAKPGAMDWMANRAVNNYAPEAVKIVDQTGHALSAGHNVNDQVTLVTDQQNGLIIAGELDIPVIEIGVLSSLDSMLVIYGIEPGVKSFAGDSIENRVAVIGIHEVGYPTMTKDAWEFIKAGIDWVTEESNAFVNMGNRVPIGFSLAQNYPNPFNPTTNINYSIGKDSWVKISIYDMLGRKIATLVNDYMERGIYNITWDASNFSAGEYIYKIEAGNFIDSKKMILVK